jgi:hypothetical protein
MSAGNPEQILAGKKISTVYCITGRSEPTSTRSATKLVPSLFDPDGERYEFFDLPLANYASSNYDSVVDADGNIVGLSMFSGYSYNEKQALGLATVDPSIPVGAEVRVSGAKKTAATQKRPSSLTSRSRSLLLSVRFPAVALLARHTARAGAPEESHNSK